MNELSERKPVGDADDACKGSPIGVPVSLSTTMQKSQIAGRALTRNLAFVVLRAQNAANRR